MRPERAPHSQTEPRPPVGPSYYKAGTIERLMAWRGTPDGRRLPGMSKAIAVTLICRAQQRFAYKCIVPDEDLAADLDCHRGSIAKYLAPLVEMGLLSYVRGGERGQKIYDCRELFKRFGEERNPAGATVSQMPKVSTSTQMTKVSTPEPRPVETFAQDGETGKSDVETATPDAQSFDVSSPSSEPSSTSLLNVDQIAKRWGIKETTGFEADIFAIADYLERWGLTMRRQRHLVKRYGLAGVTGAIGYVLHQIRCQPGVVKSPGGLFSYALDHGKANEMPVRQTPEVSTSEREGVGIEEAVKEWMRTRTGETFYRLFIATSTIDVDASDCTVRCSSLFAANQLRPRADEIAVAVMTVTGRTAKPRVVLTTAID